MFGREKLECPGCGKVFRKKDMKTQCKDAKDRNSKYYNQYSCADCCFKKTQYWEKEDAKEEGMRDAVWDGLTKTDSSEKLSRLYQERENLNAEELRLQERLWEAEDNVFDATSIYDNTVGGRPTSLFGVAIDFLRIFIIPIINIHYFYFWNPARKNWLQNSHVRLRLCVF